MATRTPRPVIQVSGFRKTYRSTVAVDDVSFEVYDGEIFELIGPKVRPPTTAPCSTSSMSCSKPAAAPRLRHRHANVRRADDGVVR
jgi:ABC-type phosphonate transport system ATPase subunit